MNIIQKIGDFIMGLFKKDAGKIFDVQAITSDDMEKAQDLWLNIIKGQPKWLSKDVCTINFAKYICQYTSKKTCLELRVSVEGSERADYINKIIKDMIEKKIRDKVEDACGLGGIIFKPNGNAIASNAIDYVMPWDYVITEQTTNGDILGIIFFDRIQKGNTFYTKLEYHHFVEGITEDGQEGRLYQIENKAFSSKNKDMLGSEIPLSYIVEWEKIQPAVAIRNIENPLFGFLKMPGNNTIDFRSADGVAIFSNCIEELRDLDIAWSRKSTEMEDSQHMTFIDEQMMERRDKKGNRVKMKLPRFIRGMSVGVDAKTTIDEHVATLLTEQRIADINSILSMISTKAGFSQGQFVLDRKTGRITATQIESDDNETVETITDIRTALKRAIKDLIGALDKYCDLVYDIPSGYVNVLDENVPDEDIFYFKDLMASFEQDRTRAYQLMIQGVYSKKKYLMEYEGFSEEEALEMMREAQEEKKEGLFDDEY